MRLIIMHAIWVVPINKADPCLQSLSHEAEDAQEQQQKQWPTSITIRPYGRTTVDSRPIIITNTDQ